MCYPHNTKLIQVLALWRPFLAGPLALEKASPFSVTSLERRHMRMMELLLEQPSRRVLHTSSCGFLPLSLTLSHSFSLSPTLSHSLTCCVLSPPHFWRVQMLRKGIITMDKDGMLGRDDIVMQVSHGRECGSGSESGRECCRPTLS